MKEAETDKGNFRLVPRACGGGSAPADVRQPLEAFPLFRRLFGVELEKVGDDFRFGRVGRKAVGGKHGAVGGELSPCFRAVNCTSV